MKQDRRRLKNKTPREIINMDGKTELKRRINTITTRKTISCKTTNHAISNVLDWNKITWILASLKNNQSFNSTADFFVRFTSLRERKLSPQEEKSIVSSRWIGVKWFHFKISRVLTAGILAYSSAAFSFSFSLALFIFLCSSTYSTSYTWIYNFLQNLRLFFQKAVGHASSRQKKRGLQCLGFECPFHMEGRTYVRTDGGRTEVTS